MLRRILCFLGKHDWKYGHLPGNWLEDNWRKCRRCPKLQWEWFNYGEGEWMDFRAPVGKYQEGRKRDNEVEFPV